MSEHQDHTRHKIIIVFSVLFVIVSILLLLIFFAGKKTYTVKFDLNGGTLVSGSLVQTVTQGQNANPPIVVKDGAYLYGWSASTDHVTKNMTVKAIWEYKTSDGIIYATGSSQNFAEILGSFEYIKGDVYLGAYYGEKKILGIRSEAFANRTGITGMYLLNGILSIGDSAFLGCTGIPSIDIPQTVTHLGANAFEGCTALETLSLHDGLWIIGDGAFLGCTALTKVKIPTTVTYIGDGAFAGCTSLVSAELSGIATYVGESAFADCSSLETLIINEGVSEIGAYAFQNCTSLREVVIPASVEKIHKNAFDGCEDLIIYASVSKEDMPEGWEKGWLGDAGVVWADAEDVVETDTEEETRVPSIRPPRPFYPFTDTEEEEITEPEESEETESESESEELPWLDIEFESIGKDYIKPDFPSRPNFPSIVETEEEPEIESSEKGKG